MSELTAPEQPSENTALASAPKRTAVPMPSPGNRSLSASQRNRTPISHSSRSSTHGDNTSNAGEDDSAATKSLSSTSRRPTKPTTSSVNQKRPSLGPPSSYLARSENQYSLKKKQYLQLKKDLLTKQKAAQTLYDEMSQLYEKLSAHGTRELGKLEELKIVVGSPKNLTIESQPQTEQPVLRIERLPIGKEVLDSLEAQLRDVPRKSLGLCQELLQKQSSFVAFVTAHLIKTTQESSYTDPADNSDMTSQLEVHQRDCNVLLSRVKEIQELEEKSVTEVIDNVGSMIEEFESSRIKLMELNAVDANKELQLQLNATMDELQAEKEANVHGKDRHRQMETQLQRSRARIRELEAHVNNDEGKIQQLQGNMKSLEGQMKQKENAVENKLKDMQKVIKNSEGLVAKVEKQRDSFEARLVELKEKMINKENEELVRIKEMSEKLSAATTEVGIEREKRSQLEEMYADLEERYRTLEDKSKQLCELAEKNKEFTVLEGDHSENELRLFNELQAAKDELEAQRQVMMQLQQEKEEIVAVMHQAASHEEDKDSREKLAADLVFKSTELQNLMMEYAELKKSAKNAQEKNGMLERQLIEIQKRLHSQSMEGGNVGLSALAIELQQQVSDLRNNLAEVIEQKESLKNALTQKQLELEQRDHVMREQNKFLKVRDELLEILKGKVEQENGESHGEENNEYLEQVHKQIAAKTEALQELYTTLKNKQLQIMHLEKMVKLMEVQQDRAQAQRTRLENRIAQLELTLHRSKEQRSKGFGIL